LNPSFKLVLNQMRYIAAYLLAALGGNAAPDAAAVKAILDSVGVSTDDASLDKVIAELKGKTIEEVIADGSEKLASVPSGGGGGGGGGGGAADASGGGEAAAAAPEPAAKSESEEEDMGFGLFD